MKKYSKPSSPTHFGRLSPRTAYTPRLPAHRFSGNTSTPFRYLSEDATHSYAVQDPLKSVEVPFIKKRSEMSFLPSRRNSGIIQNVPSYNHRNTQKSIICQYTDISASHHSSTMKDIENLVTNEKRKRFFDQIGKRVRPQEKKKLSGQDFEVLKLLGKGKYGKVFLIKDKASGFLMALKVIEKKKVLESDLLQQFIREIKIQFYLDHPGIVKLYGCFDDVRNFYLLMELGCDGELYQLTAKKLTFSEQSASFVARNLLQVLAYIHSKQVIHRDLKPENVVMILGTVKLCDFGWAVHNNFQMRSTFCGTPLYFSPELLEGKQYDQKIDLWAIGVIVYELVLGKSPFNLEKPRDLSKIVTDQIDFPTSKPVSALFRNFVSAAMEKNPVSRHSADSLLLNPYIKKYWSSETCDQLCHPLGKKN